MTGQGLRSFFDTVSNSLSKIHDRSQSRHNVLREFLAFVIEFVDGSICIQERIGNCVSHRRRNDSKEGFNRRGEVLSTKRNHCDDGPQEESKDGRKGETEQSSQRQGNESKQRRQCLLNRFDENASSCERHIQHRRQETSCDRNVFKITDEKQKGKENLDHYLRVGTSHDLYKPSRFTSQEVILRHLHGDGDFHRRVRSSLLFLECCQLPLKRRIPSQSFDEQFQSCFCLRFIILYAVPVQDLEQCHCVVSGI